MKIWTILALLTALAGASAFAALPASAYTCTTTCYGNSCTTTCF